MRIIRVAWARLVGALTRTHSDDDLRAELEAHVEMATAENIRRGMDPVIVKAFVNLLGIYPVGTFVVLDTFELAIVHSANPVPEMLSRPMALLVSDDLGNVKHPGDLVDLAEQDAAGNYVRTIIKTADPDRYGVRVGDYFI